MIKNVWKKYIHWLLNYLDTDHGINQWKMALIQLITMGIMGIIGIVVFYYLIIWFIYNRCRVWKAFI